MYKEYIKENVNIGIILPNEFYVDLILSELSIIYYGEKMARIIYKKINKNNLSQIEKKHEILIKKILIKPTKLDIKIFNFFKYILKLKDEKKYLSFCKDLEYYSIFRYQTMIKFIENKETLKILEDILEDEINHLDKKIVPTYQSNFGGYENEYLYQKYKHILMIDYQEFKERMWQTDFCKNLRGL